MVISLSRNHSFFIKHLYCLWGTNCGLDGLPKHIRGLLWEEPTHYFWSIYSVSSNQYGTLLNKVIGEKTTPQIQSNKKTPHYKEEKLLGWSLNPSPVCWDFCTSFHMGTKEADLKKNGFCFNEEGFTGDLNVVGESKVYIKYKPITLIPLFWFVFFLLPLCP